MILPKHRIPESVYRFRGVTPSGDINEFIKTASGDIYSLFDAINNNVDKLNDIYSISNIENRFLYEKIKELEDIIEEKDMLYSNNNIITSTLKVKDMEVGNSSPANISNEYNQITISDIKYTPKLYLYDQVNDTSIIPESVNPLISYRFVSSETGEGINVQTSDIIIHDNNINNMIDGSASTCWQRSVGIPLSYGTPYLITEVTVRIPYEIVSNTIINTISLIAHPINSIDVLDIQIKTGDSWTRIPGFTDHSQYNITEDYIPNSKPLRFIFGDTSITDIKVTLRQKTPIVNGNNNTYYVGIYTLEAGYIDSPSKDGKFAIVATLKNSSNKITSITSKIDNSSIVPDAFGYELFYINELGAPIGISNKLPIVIPSNKVLVSGTIERNGITVPVLSGLIIEYEPL